APLLDAQFLDDAAVEMLDRLAIAVDLDDRRRDDGAVEWGIGGPAAKAAKAAKEQQHHGKAKADRAARAVVERDGRAGRIVDRDLGHRRFPQAALPLAAMLGSQPAARLSPAPPGADRIRAPRRCAAPAPCR